MLLCRSVVQKIFADFRALLPETLRNSSKKAKHCLASRNFSASQRVNLYRASCKAHYQVGGKNPIPEYFKCTQHDTPAGIFCASPEQAAHWQKAGVNLLAISVDVAFLLRAAQQALLSFRDS